MKDLSIIFFKITKIKNPVASLSLTKEKNINVIFLVSKITEK